MAGDIRFSGVAYAKLPRVVGVLCTVAERRFDALAAAVAVTTAVQRRASTQPH
jgi:hypothetical protein